MIKRKRRPLAKLANKIERKKKQKQKTIQIERRPKENEN